MRLRTPPSLLFTGDGGPATLARLNAPLGVAYESPLGGLFLSNQWDNRVRYVSPLGIISTVMGTGVASLTGDGGRATLATLNNPSIGTDDGVGGWLISDANNNVVRARGCTYLGVAGDCSTVALLLLLLVVAPCACLRSAASRSRRVRRPRR